MLHLEKTSEIINAQKPVDIVVLDRDIEAFEKKEVSSHQSEETLVADKFGLTWQLS